MDKLPRAPGGVHPNRVVTPATSTPLSYYTSQLIERTHTSYTPGTPKERSCMPFHQQKFLHQSLFYTSAFAELGRTSAAYKLHMPACILWMQITIPGPAKEAAPCTGDPLPRFWYSLLMRNF